MAEEIIEIEVYNKRNEMSGAMYVEQCSEHVFRAYENEFFLCDIRKGTEFETRINAEGKHQIIRIVKASPYNTRQFLMSTGSGMTESDLRAIGAEITKDGGYWQADFGGIVTINLLKDSTIDLDAVINGLGLSCSEILPED